jgi:DNA mismatch repair protein MutL
MSDIIRLLSDRVANQIAAGEVIQRPASVVKELVENAIDAGCQAVQVIIKDAGKTLIQIVDDGCGMSDTDARMAFEKHATSKIRSADDLFNIRTKGFRGEALASIGAVAQVELKTKLAEDNVGTKIEIAGSTIKSQEACQCPTGTAFQVKNLFFNVPARREFLKSDAVEFRHIIDEFQRVAFTHPDVAFSLHHNGNEIFNLPATPLRQRIVRLLGPRYDQRLVPMAESTDIVQLEGFIGKPEYAKKSRGEQFFFVNDRFIRNHYLHHAVTRAFEELLPKGFHPLYLIYMTIDPSEIDVNIHPTKTEIKFKDERSIYAIINSAVKQSLGKFNITPSIDFNTEVSINVAPLAAGQEVKQPNVKVNPQYNPFVEKERKQGLAGRFGQKNSAPDNWQEVFEVTKQVEIPQEIESRSEPIVDASFPVFQIAGKYIASRIKSGLIVVNQQLAHERILYEKHLMYLSRNCGCTQQLLFPQTLDLSPSDFEIVKSREDDIRALGFDFEEFGKSTYKFAGLPAESRSSNVDQVFDSFLDQIKNHTDKLQSEPQRQLALALARSLCISEGTSLSHAEMRQLLDELFGCEVPNYSPGGAPTVATFTHKDLEEQFK